MKPKMKALILLLSISGSALADDAALLRCRSITETSTRLACYDALVIQPTDAKAAPAGGTVPPASRPSSAASSPSSGPPAASVQQRTDQFGLENRSAPGTVDAIESYIPGRFEGWEAKSSIKLANGQVWQIADDSSRYLTLTDPKVRIRRGSLGAFYLEFEKVNHSPRVRRVQ